MASMHDIASQYAASQNAQASPQDAANNAETAEGAQTLPPKAPTAKQGIKWGQTAPVADSSSPLQSGDDSGYTVQDQDTIEQEETQPESDEKASEDVSSGAWTQSELAESMGGEEELLSAEFSVKIDGKETTLPLKDILKDYQTSASVTQRSQKLSEERKRLETELETERTNLRAQAQQAQITAQFAEQALHQQWAGTNWEQIAVDDPERFQQAQRQFMQQQQQLKQFKEQQAQHEQQYMRSVVQKEYEKLLDLDPSYMDESTLRSDIEMFRSEARKYGATAQQAGSPWPAWMVLAMKKATAYDRLQTRQPAQQQTRQPRTLRPRGGRSSQQTNADEISKLQDVSGIKSMRDIGKRYAQMQKLKR